MKRALFALAYVLTALDSANTAEVMVDLRVDPNGTFDLYLEASQGDNYGIAAYAVKLANFSSLTHVSPHLAYATNSAMEKGPAGFTLLRSADDYWHVHASQDTIYMTPHLIRGFGQTASSFSNEGIGSVGSPPSMDSWDAPLKIATGTWSGSMPTYLSAAVNVFDAATGLGVKAADVSLVGGQPMIELSSNRISLTESRNLDFGRLQHGSTLERTFTIKNSGTSTLKLVAPTLSGPYSLAGSFPNSIPTDGEASFTVTMDASQSGSFNNFLSFGTNIDDQPTFDLQLSGVVMDPAAPVISVSSDGSTLVGGSVVDFGELLQGASRQRTFTIENTGTADLVLGSPEVGDQFMLASAFPSLIRAGRSASFTIAIDSTVVGESSETLKLISNVDSMPTLEFLLTGNIQERTDSNGGNNPISTIDIWDGDSQFDLPIRYMTYEQMIQQGESGQWLDPTTDADDLEPTSDGYPLGLTNALQERLAANGSIANRDFGSGELHVPEPTPLTLATLALLALTARARRK